MRGAALLRERMVAVVALVVVAAVIQSAPFNVTFARVPTARLVLPTNEQREKEHDKPASRRNCNDDSKLHYLYLSLSLFCFVLGSICDSLTQKKDEDGREFDACVCCSARFFPLQRMKKEEEESKNTPLSESPLHRSVDEGCG